MSEFRKTSPDDLYFFTMTVAGWVDVFTRQIYRDIIIKNLQWCQQNDGLEIYCYVIMSNHLHMIARRKNADLTELLGRFKSFTAKQLLQQIKENEKESRKEWLLYLFRYFAANKKQYKEFHFWKYTNHPTLLDYPQIIDQKAAYIQDNPVKAGLVLEPEHWIYSSACPASPLKCLPL